MPYKDHQPLTFERHMGLYTNYESAPLPPGYDIDCQNMCWDIPDPGVRGSAFRGSIRTREIFEDTFTLTNTNVKWYIYTKSTGGRIIYLDNNGNFRDHTAGTIILNISGCTNFHGITVNDHFYFTPSNGLTGLAGEAVYVYDPTLSATARKAAGRGPDEALDPPVGAFAVAVSATAGNIEPGLHVISVSYEYDTGFISKPQIWRTFTAPAARRRVDLTNIPTGPAGVVARHIWMSHRINDYDGNPEKVETFFVYEIANNVTTSLPDVVDAYDSQLIQSSDPYADLLTEIPAGSYLNLIKGRLVVCGSDANKDTLYISNSFEPEAVDAVDGLKTVYKGSGGAIYTTRNIRNLLSAHKAFRTYILEPTDEVPRLWQDKQLDCAIGAYPQSIGEVLNEGNADRDFLIVADTSGVHAFDGQFRDNLVDNIKATYCALLATNRLDELNVTVDPIAKRIYVLLPQASTGVNTKFFMIDYKLGLTKDAVRISYWELPAGEDITDMHVVISSVNARGTLLISKNGDNNIAKQTVGEGLDIEEFGTDLVCKLRWLIAHPELSDVHLNMAKIDLHGNGGGTYEVADVTSGTNISVPVTSSTASENQIDEVPLNIWNKVIEIGIDSVDSGFMLAKFIAYFGVKAETRVAV